MLDLLFVSPIFLNSFLCVIYVTYSHSMKMLLVFWCWIKHGTLIEDGVYCKNTSSTSGIVAITNVTCKD